MQNDIVLIANCLDGKPCVFPHRRKYFPSSPQNNTSLYFLGFDAHQKCALAEIQSTLRAAFWMHHLTMEMLNRVRRVAGIKSLLQSLIPFVSLETYLLINPDEHASQ